MFNLQTIQKYSKGNTMPEMSRKRDGKPVCEKLVAIVAEVANSESVRYAADKYGLTSCQVRHYQRRFKALTHPTT